MNETLSELGIYLTDVLEKLGLSRERLRLRLGVSSEVINQLFYYNVKVGVRQPKVQILRDLAAALDLDFQELLSLAGYDLPISSVIPDPPYSVTLGEFLEQIMLARGISHNRLSELAGISQGTVHNLLRQGRDGSVAEPRPRVLRSVCEVLGLDQLFVFQLAGYIDPNYQPPAQKLNASHVEEQFDAVPAESNPSPSKN